MQYAFKCASPKHPEQAPREFVQFVHLSSEAMKRGKVISQWACPVCHAPSPRDLAQEIPTQRLLGMKTVSKSTTTKGSLYDDVKFAFGRHKVNPDGTVDKNHAPFRDVKELQSYMDGNNELGPIATDDKGRRMRKPDGTYIRRGEKLMKYGANDTPSRDVIRKSTADDRGVTGDCWVDSPMERGRSAERPLNPSIGALKGVGEHRSPIRKKRSG